MDIEAFGTSYKKYDLISSKFDSWIYIYPFCELLIGVSFLNSSPPYLIIFIALILGISGIISVFKAFYLDKLKLIVDVLVDMQIILWELLVLSKIF